METPSILSRVQWSPEEEHQLATVSAVDSAVYFWDVRRPFFPCAGFGGPENCISDLAFARRPGHAGFLACGRDRRLYLFGEEGENRVACHRPYALVGSSPFNELLCSGECSRPVSPVRAAPDRADDAEPRPEFDFSESVQSSLVHFSNPPAAVNFSNKFAELAKQ